MISGLSTSSGVVMSKSTQVRWLGCSRLVPHRRRILQEYKLSERDSIEQFKLATFIA